MKPMAPMKAPGNSQWPEKLGEHPSSAGGQNEMRYEFRGSQAAGCRYGRWQNQMYDTGDHRISGVQQYQSGSGREVMFTSQHGEGDLATLKPV